MKSGLTRRQVVLGVSLSIVGPALLAACGGTATPPTTAPTTAPATAPTSAPAPTAATAPTAAPTTAPAVMAPPTPTSAASAADDRAADQTLRLTGFGDASVLEPAKEGGTLRVMTQNVWRPPFYLDEKGELLPGVCTKWEASNDGLTYTLHLDPKAVFSDGSQITADDLKFSWEHLADPATKTWSAPYVVGPVVGYDDVVNGKAKDIKGLVVKDAQTLEITLTAPYTPFIKSMATYIAGVVSKNDPVTQQGWEAKSRASGPYQIDAWNPQTGEVTWVPNKNWWGPKPVIQKVTYRYIKDANTQSISYDNNEIDIFEPTDIIAAEMHKGSHANEMHLIPYGGVYYYMFRTDRKPMDDPNVRLALLKATDMGTIVQAVFQGGDSPAYGLISPNLDAYSNPKSYYDPAGAKMALAASTYKTAENLPPISIAVGSNLTEYIRTSEAMQQMWKKNLGIDVAVHPYDKNTDPILQSAQVVRKSIGTTVNDPSTSVSAMGLSTNTTVALGLGGYKDPEVDALLKQADAMPLNKESERVTLYQQAEKTMMTKDAPYIPIIWVQYYYAVKPWIKNYAANNDLCLYTLASNTPLYIAKH